MTTCTYIGPTVEDSAYARLQPTCCAAVVPGRSYCEEHLWLVYKQGTAVHRKKDKRTAESVWNLQDAFNEAVAELEAEGFDCYGDAERAELL
jgi:hypothetical protein